MRAGIYARTSSQGRELSIGEQVRLCRGWARERKARVVEVYSDAGVSGTRLDRPELARAMLDAKAKRIDVLLVMDLDRLARDLIVQETIIGELRLAGVESYSVNQPNLEGDDPSRVFARQIMGAVAQYNRAMTVMRLRLGKEAKARAGGHAHGHPRFGYKAERGKLLPAPDEQAAVAVIRRCRREGASYRAVCAELERRGMKPRSGAKWHPNSVRRIFLRGRAA